MLVEDHAEKRAKPRRRVAKAAKMTWGDFIFVRDCALRDVSLTGARVTVKAAHEVPDEFYLIFSADRTMRKACVIWRRGEEIGVEFDGEIRNLMQDPDPRLRQFRFM
jgi:PilZ domain